MLRQLRQLSEEVERALSRHQKHGQTIVLKVRYDDFQTITKRVTLRDYIRYKEDIFSQITLIWENLASSDKGIRLLGITLTNLDPVTYENIVLPLWEK